MKRALSLMALLLALAVMLAACGQQPGAAVQQAAPTVAAAVKAAAPTVAAEVKAAAPTVAAAVQPAAPKATDAAKAAGQPTKGGQVTMAVWQEPATLNQLISSQTVVDEVAVFFGEPLLGAGPDGSYYPALAKEIPTQANGGVSADGKTITWKLKEGVKWSDGQPFTCEDVKFTWQAHVTPNVGVISTTGFSDMESVECPDPLTAVVKYKNFYAPFLNNFYIIIPKHYAGDPAQMKDWKYNSMPLGTGPYKVDEYQKGSYIALSRNPNYRDPNKPYLDKVIIRIVPSSEVAKQLLRSGEIDIMWNNTEADYPELEKMQGIKISDPVQIGGERLFLNLTKPGEPSDNKTPHPILGDQKVRQAIAYGINKQQIIDKLLFGKALPGSSELNAGFFNCEDIKPYPYDPAKAEQLLDEAGWKKGADGIREKDGQKLRLKYQTTSGNKLREDSQVLIVEDMKKIGIDLFIENQPSALLIGSWANKSPRKWGNFDIIMYTTNAALDPHSQMLNQHTSGSIPSEQNQGGQNYPRWNDPETDAAVKEGGNIPDQAKRKEAYCKAAKRVVDGAPHIYLYQRRDIDSYRDRLQGWIPNAWDNNGWNAADWWVSR